MSAPLLEVVDLVRHFTLPREKLFAPAPLVRAVNGVSFTMTRGRSLGLVGESGSGKSTIARLAIALDRPSAGRVAVLGRDLAAQDATALREMRRHMQMIFQDPYGSLDPRQTVGRIVAEPLEALTGADRDERLRRVREVLTEVGLAESAIGRYPHEFSGGQRQRIATARALVTRPDLIVADEPVSALDVSVRAQVLNLLRDLAEREGVTFLMISHDLAVVDYVCDEIVVLYAGRIVESGPSVEVLRRPAHPYTKALIAAASRHQPGTRRVRAKAEGPPAPPAAKGCAFAPRCPIAVARCREERPALRPMGGGMTAACHLA
jgi:peptide/nickel transport system ATP-binding protein